MSDARWFEVDEDVAAFKALIDPVPKPAEPQ